MKVALVHDYLNQYGGAERVLEALLRIFPDADLYTLLYSKERTLGRFDHAIKGTSFLDYQFVSRHHRAFIPLMPLAAERMRLGDAYDVIISDSAGYAKGISYGPNTFHITYCHTPLRYAWETSTYFENKIFTTLFRPAFSYLARWDLRVAQKAHIIVAVSGFIREKIKRYYGRGSVVVYPPVDHKKFFYDPARASTPSYYLAAGRLLHYKRFDLVVEAARELGLPLRIVGIGPEEKRLKLLAKNAPNIEFLSFVSDNDLRDLYAGARAFIFPQVEDFGLVAAEALACGTPVVAFKGGGALEIVNDGATGIFFEKETVESLMEALKKVEHMKFDRSKIAASTEKFSFAHFKNGILNLFPPHLRTEAEKLRHLT
jgi:glycosyltransferase involved in cell wall biosynthesis